VELKRAGQHGFGQAELDRARESLMAQIERSVPGEEPDREPGAGERIREPLSRPGAGTRARQRVAYASRSPRRLARGRERGADRMWPRTAGPHRFGAGKAGVTPPAEADLRAASSGRGRRRWTPGSPRGGRPAADGRAAEAGRGDRHPRHPRAGSHCAHAIQRRRGLDEATDFKNDQILFSCYAKGGSSIADPDDYPGPRRAAQIIGEEGIGGFQAGRAGKALAGKLVGGQPYITAYTHGSRESARRRTSRTGLQLPYLTFTSDRPGRGVRRVFGRNGTPTWRNGSTIPMRCSATQYRSSTPWTTICRAR
jgi:hypothetical protein